MKQFKVTLTTAADGTVTGYSPKLSGEIVQIEYVKDVSNAYADGVDFAITGEKTGIGIWTESNVNASAVRAPRQPTHSQSGAALLYAAGGAAVADRIGLWVDRLKFVLAQGGNAKVGPFYITVA